MTYAIKVDLLVNAESEAEAIYNFRQKVQGVEAAVFEVTEEE